MPKLSEAELLARDAQRNLNAELLESAAQLRAGKLGQVSVVTRDGRVIDSPVTKARPSTRMSQSQFAILLGVSKRTLQDWEQGRWEPSGAAKTLLRVAERHSEVLRGMVET